MTTKKTDCHKTNIQDDLKAYIDNELPELRRFVVSLHLSRCAHCRQEMNDMEEIGTALKPGSEQPELPSALKARILENAPVDTAGVSSPLTGPAARPSLPAWLSPKSGLTYCGVALLLFFLITPVTQRARENARRSSRTVFNASSSALSTSTTGSEDEYSGVRAGAPAAAIPDFNSPDNRIAGGASSEAVDSASRTTLQRNLKVLPGLSSGTRGTLNTESVPSSLRKVHKEARITVEVKQVEDATNETIALVKGVGGYIANNTLSTGADGAKTATIEARIPVGNFETVLGQVGKQGEVRAKNIVGEDITQQYSDAQQETNVVTSELGVREAQLNDALKRAQKKDKPGQIPWQQRAEVRELRVRAAQARARLGLLKKISDLANISIELQEKAKVPGEGGFVDNISLTGHEAMQTFLVAARVPVNCIMWILAYSPLWLPLLIGARFLFAKTQRSV